MLKDGSHDLTVEKIVVVPPDGGWGWVVVAAAFTIVLVMDGISNSFGLFIPILQREFNASVSQVSLINSLFTGFYFIFAPIAGSLSNRFGFRLVIIAGSVISSIGLAVSIFSNSINILFLTYGFIGGFGFSMMYINVILTVGFYFEKWRPLATGITVSASGVGTFLFAPVVQILLKKYPWKNIFLAYSCLVFSCSIVAICFRPITPLTIENLEENEKVKKPERKIAPMSNSRYPTAANAIDLNLFKDSKITLKTSRLGSVESFELYKYSSKEYYSTRDSEIKRRTTDFSQFQTAHDLTMSVPTTSATPSRFKYIHKMRNYVQCCKNCKNCNYSDVKKWCDRKKSTGVRPMYRDDIFYEGSVAQLSIYDKNSALFKITASNQSTLVKSSLLYHLSVTRLPTYRDLQEERDKKCHLFPESITRTLKTMFDVKVMKYSLFIMFTTSTCFSALGINVPSHFAYVTALGTKLMNEDDASLLLSAIGITNTMGRIICGLIASVPKINIIILHFGFLFFGALLNVCVVFFRTKETFFIYATLFGLVLAEQGSSRSIILVKLVGLENLTNAFGILLLFLGIFTVIGTPTAGYMKELIGSFDAVFLFSSFFLLLAALTLVPLFVGKFKHRRNTQQL